MSEEQKNDVLKESLDAKEINNLREGVLKEIEDNGAEKKSAEKDIKEDNSKEDGDLEKKKKCCFFSKLKFLKCPPSLKLWRGKASKGEGKNSHLKFIVGFLIGIVAVAAVFFGIMSVGIYHYNWQNNFTNKLISIIPYPAAVVDYHLVSLKEYQEDAKTINNFYAKQVEAGNVPPSSFDPAKINKDVLEKLIKDQIINGLAKDNQVSVSQAEIDAEYKKIEDSQGADQVKSVLADLYGWTPEQFKAKIIQSTLLQTKLMDKIFDLVNKDTKVKAEEVLAQAKDGKSDFAELAKKYSEDTGAVQGGDLGYFSKGAMIPAFEQAVFAMEKGQISDLVRTQFGYHIIKVVDVKKDAGGQVTQIRASHILFKTQTLNDYILSIMPQHKVWRLIKV